MSSPASLRTPVGPSSASTPPGHRAHHKPDLADASLYDGLVFSTIIQVKIGDWAFGTSAHEGNLLLTIRGLYEKDMEALDTRVRDLVIAEAEKDGLEVKFSTTDYFPETRNHDVSNAKILRVCEKLESPPPRLSRPIAGPNFGHLTKRVPGAMFVVGNGVDAPGCTRPIMIFRMRFSKSP